ncbi:MAG: cytochrome c [Chloroflexi bacterium]|nr:MAG: cytochrome c [Chloroflexota bacterium]MBL1197451.1 cytochrome c [Chloroflexota bacterium]NOH14746.1 cytochrome c [Chloroflexota bacterium]
MRTKFIILAASLLVLIGAIWVTVSSNDQGAPITIVNTSVPPAPPLDTTLVREGETLYQQSCARCHGANLEGEANWRVTKEDGSLPSPPHDSSGHTWHHPDSLLLEIIANGGDPQFNSTMPGFADSLTEDEMIAILEFLKSSWKAEDREYQWWISAVEQGNTIP